MLQLRENKYTMERLSRFISGSTGILPVIHRLEACATGFRGIMILAVTILAITSGKVYAQEPILASALIEKIREYDGKTVTFQGEAIGDLMHRRRGIWVNLLDGSGTALGVWLTPKQAQLIKTLGSYNYKGDVVQVTGVFNRACSEHQGEIDLHAASCRIVTPGEPIKHPVSLFRLQLALVVLLLAFLLIFIWKRYFKPKVEAKKF
ncbi:MAG: DNA-binding protein [Candidatus Schekmanbacteria bacterium]|nr:DNA-binding protein [Candidatus Schekmanbacteria bacterium]